MADRVEAGERGETRIADRVVAKIAAQAAREALDTAGEGGPTGVPDGGAPPHATVTVHRGSARVRISLELGYPCDIGGRCGAVRRQVVERVRALAGIAVPEVAVQVERLHASELRAAQGRERVR